MSKRRQSKSGSKPRRKKIARTIRAEDGRKRVIYADGSQQIDLSPEGAEFMKFALEEQKKAFREKFGREMTGSDPIFFDPDADEPRPRSEASFQRQWDESVSEALKAGLPPQFAFAMWATNRIVSEHNAGLLTEDELQEWEDAVDEYLNGESERSRLFRVVTVEGGKAKSVEDVKKLLSLAKELGVYDAVVKRFREATHN